MKTRVVALGVGLGLGVIAVAAVGWWYVRGGDGAGGGETAESARDAAASAGDRPGPPSGPVDRPGPGDVRLSGTVLDAAGEPVAGVEITAEWELGPGVESLAPAAIPAAPPGSSSEAIRDAGPDGSPGGLELNPAVVAVTGQDGTFDLIGLVAGRYRLRVEGPGIFTSELRFFEVPADGIRLVVARKVSVRGRVVDEAGAGVASATVYIAGESAGGTLTTTSNPSGGFAFDNLQEGIFQLWAASGERAARVVRVSRLGSGSFGPVTLLMEAAEIVSGRVVERGTDRGVAAAVMLSSVAADQPARHVRSAGDGSFRIDGVLPGRWSAEAHAPGFVAVEAIDFEVGKSFVPIIELRRGGTIAGKVVDPSGTAIVGATVSARGIDPDGRVLIASEASQIRQTRQSLGAEGAALGAGIPGAATLESGARFIPRGELGVLLGPIPYPPPRGAAALRIAQSLEDPAGRAIDPLPVRDDVVPRFVSDTDGSFRLTGIEPGTYRVVVRHPEYADGFSEVISVALGQAIEDLVIVVAPGVVLTGEVTNTRGELVVGATIIADPLPDKPGKPGKVNKASKGPGAASLEGGRRDPGGAAARLAGEDAAARIQAVTGSDGRYRLGPIAHSVALHVTAVRHGDVRRTVELGELSDRLDERREDFVLPVADAELAGRVVDGVGFPVRGASVRIDSDDRGADGRLATTDEHGRFSITGLAPGDFSLAVSHDKFPPATGKGKTGEPVAVTLPFGGGIAGEVRDSHTGGPVTGARVTATGPDKKKHDAATGSDGSITLMPLVAGKWTLQVSAPGYVPVSKTVEVTAGREPGAITVRDVRLSLARGAVVAGVVRNAVGERVRGAVVRVAGATATSNENGEFRLEDVATGDDMEIVAERDGVRGSIEVSLRPGDEVVTLEIKLGE